jgi:hypothetical protein
MKTYYTRVSTGLVAFIVVVCLICCLPGITEEGGWRLLIGIGITLPLLLLLLFIIKYTIDGTTLRVSVFFFKDEFDLTKLVSVVPTRTLLSAPASSLKRIRLEFSNGDAVIISPRHQEDFLAELRRINPKVQIDESLLL